MGEKKDKKENQGSRIRLSAPDLVNICIDRNEGGEISGRIYHCWDREAWEFSDIVRLLKEMERLFDSIGFPQASTQARKLAGQGEVPRLRGEKVAEPEEVIAHSGKKGSFITCVRFRQNADWQGEITWKEKNISWSFHSTLEFLKRIDNALD